jgi:tight adherence protein B
MSIEFTLILILVFVGLAALAVGSAVFFFQRYNNPEPSLIHQRLIRIKARQQQQDEQAESEAMQRFSKLYREGGYNNENLGKQLEQLNFFNHLKVMMQQAGMKTPPDKYFITSMVMPSVLLTVLGLATGMLPLALLGPGAGVLAYFAVVFKRGKRFDKFVTQLPDALSMITSALRAGHSFQSALGVVATELADPIGTEFSNIVRDINLGIPVKEALNRMVSKLDALPDVRMFATAVLIQREAGGNLAEILEKLGYTIRERFKLKGQIASLTGQARLTGYVLGGAPAFLLVGLSAFMYGYVKPLWETDLGHVMLILAVIMQGIGFFIMKKIVDIRV